MRKYIPRLLTGLLVLGGFVGASDGSAADRTPHSPVAQARDDAPNVVISPIPASDKAKLKYAEDAQEEMREGLLSLQKRVDEARKAKDIVFLNCLNEKYSSVNALLKVTETATILMQEALAQNNAQAAEHQFRKVAIAREKARQALQDAAECTENRGELSGGSEDATVTLEGGDHPLTDQEQDILNPVDTVPIVDIPPSG